MKRGRVRQRIRLVVAVVGAVAMLIVWRTVAGPLGLSPQGMPAEIDTTRDGTPASAMTPGGPWNSISNSNLRGP